MKRIGIISILIFAFFGLANSAYLAQQEARGEPLFCNIQNFSGCTIVAASPYSQFFGIPLAEFGVLFYSILLVLAALELVIFDYLLRRVIQAVSLIGVIASLYFTIIQAFIIDAFCIYCVASAFIALLVFICAGFIEPIRRSAEKNPPPIIPPRAPPSYLSMPPMP